MASFIKRSGSWYAATECKVGQGIEPSLLFPLAVVVVLNNTVVKYEINRAIKFVSGTIFFNELFCKAKNDPIPPCPIVE